LSLVATITVSGDPQLLREYRGQVNRLLDEEGGGSYRELHTSERLEYELKLQGGIPFPPFVSASQAFPGLTVEVKWSEAALGKSGRAIIRNGVLAEQAVHSHAPGGAVANDVRAGDDGGLELAVSCARWREHWHGYVIAAGEHAFFRVAGSAQSCELRASDGADSEWAERWRVSHGDPAYGELAPREPIAEDELRELDRLAQEFAREWIWFEESPPEETAVERQRFAAYGYPVRAANLRMEKLRNVLRPDAGGLGFGSFADDARWIPGLLRRCWLRTRITPTK
jgi:hypothetical protein